jgi:predicted outer membrane lipoprotein
VQSAAAALSLILFAMAGADPYLQVFLVMVAPGVLTVVLLQALCSVAVFRYFARHGRRGASRWSTAVAPAVSALGLTVAAALIAQNFDLLSGRTDWVNVLLLGTLPVAFAVGVLRALWLRRFEARTYVRLTRTGLS